MSDGVVRVGGGYTYEPHMGGYILRSRESGVDVFIQPGDDAEVFRINLQNTSDTWTAQDVVEEYMRGAEGL